MRDSVNHGQENLLKAAVTMWQESMMTERSIRYGSYDTKRSIRYGSYDAKRSIGYLHLRYTGLIII